MVLFLFVLTLRFRTYSAGEFASLVYAIFFLNFGVGLYLVRIGMDIGLPVNDHSNMLWFFSIMFFGTAVHMFLKNSSIIRRQAYAESAQIEHIS